MIVAIWSYSDKKCFLDHVFYWQGMTQALTDAKIIGDVVASIDINGFGAMVNVCKLLIPIPNVKELERTNEI